MTIVAEAQIALRSAGVDQWQNGYPDREVLQNDIVSGNLYVALDGATVVAMAAIVFDGEPTYRSIDGCWLNDRPYSVVHRIAVAPFAKGHDVAARFFDFAERLTLQHSFDDIRIDTHRDNRAMQRALAKSGYRFCGIIELTDHSPRNAYQKVLRGELTPKTIR